MRSIWIVVRLIVGTLVSVTSVVAVAGCSPSSPSNPPSVSPSSSQVSASVQYNVRDSADAPESKAAMRYIDALNKGSRQEILAATAGSLNSQYSQLTDEEVASRVAASKHQRGDRHIRNLSLDRMGSGTAFLFANLWYDHLGSDPEKKGRTVEIGLLDVRGEWKVVSDSVT